MNNVQDTYFDLLDRINSLRELMITAGQQYGLGDSKTLRYSEQLDELIFQYQLQNK